MSDDQAAPIVGELVSIPESGYRFGRGDLVLRVTEVGPVAEPGWIRITGHEVSWDGGRIGTRSVVAKRADITLVRHPA